MHDKYLYQQTTDTHSFAEPQKAVVTHLHLAIKVDFDNQKISGQATYNIKVAPNADEIIFDINNLKILKILLDDKTEATYKVGNSQPYLGQPLIIKLLPGTQKVTIWYETPTDAAALQWLSPAQTGGKRYPFLFTQSQAILARTWLPCQDSPGIRFTYEAQVAVPPQFLALMSALNPQRKNPTGIYTFKQERPIPSYLMALAVGNLEFKPLDNRTGVYAEPEQLAAAYQEFAQLPDMVTAAENLYGTYLWNRYDLLLLPPSFPFGGMENPMLTFVTPTIIAGDRSLTSLVAHELAHSWSGNLVTNATWNDFWLNEGFTVYFERRIMEALNGQDYADMLKVLGYQDLKQILQELGPDSPDTHLKLNLTNRDPDEGLTEIAYEKGNYFLLALEEKYGREYLDKFIREYFTQHAFRAMDTELFLKFLQENLLTQPGKLELQVQPEEWIYKANLPENKPELKSRRFGEVAGQSEKYKTDWLVTELNTTAWSTHEWLYFLHLLEPTLDPKQLKDLDAAFNLTNSGNAEILAVWFGFAIQHDYKPAYPALEKFLSTVGRRKFLMPLYKGLKAKNPGWATQIYKSARANYHAVATSSLDKLLLT
ncbi:M1 family metallopeptidase [Adhaeribacter rhizoryzae]|uniref:Aminopeptidase N n=1 Tax=Adhaeribacter rhizoryzae TaxID=2607907 RepID=A0A5M6DK92_9BACT|nr:M1 family metallopeptidase [Adhaeribacter rhizoryzae]KAA5547967.1 M1 family metallopeptidase [Adhaeribacter rhizoryzae]